VSIFPVIARLIAQQILTFATIRYVDVAAINVVGVDGLIMSDFKEFCASSTDNGRPASTPNTGSFVHVYYG
jgi:hypothetical protein